MRTLCKENVYSEVICQCIKQSTAGQTDAECDSLVADVLMSGEMKSSVSFIKRHALYEATFLFTKRYESR